jgi:hypothetical protein
MQIDNQIASHSWRSQSTNPTTFRAAPSLRRTLYFRDGSIGWITALQHWQPLLPDQQTSFAKIDVDVDKVPAPVDASVPLVEPGGSYSSRCRQ